MQIVDLTDRDAWTLAGAPDQAGTTARDEKP